MQGWLSRMLRETIRQATPGASRNRTSAPVGSVSPPPAEAIPSTLVTEEGYGVDLLLLNEDELDNEAFYLGDDPIEENDY